LEARGAFFCNIELVISDPTGPVRLRAENEEIEVVVIHPVLSKAFIMAEHPEGQLHWLGDALGTDFMVVQFLDGWMRMYRGDGRANEDWFGWGAEVLAPFDGMVRFVRQPTGVNTPGNRGDGKAGSIMFEREDGVWVILGHVMEIAVSEGEEVLAGQVVARLGNNGTSWCPHLHVGAWKGDQPLQIRVDLAMLGRMVAVRGEGSYYGLEE
jgi:hypothetical protein